MPVIVVGAGATGLTVAERLLEAGKDVVVLEREPAVGGLCRSYHYGDFTFDIGPHRLFSANPDIQAYFLSILGGAHAVTPRDSMVQLRGKYLAWPLTFGAVFRLPPSDTLKCLRDLLSSNNHSGQELQNLEDYVVTRYGRTIYDIFWRGYTEKFLGVPCTEVDASWGALSVGRSVVNRKAQPLSLAGLLKACLLPRSKHLSFIYPLGGMGDFPEKCAARIRRRGGRILVSQEITELAVKNGQVTEVVANATRYIADTVVWTGQLPDLCARLDVPGPELSYLSTVLYNVEIGRKLPGKWQWIYYPDTECVFSRVSRPSLFSATTVPNAKTGLCVEVSCMAGDHLWRNPGSLQDRVISDLLKVKLIDSPDEVDACHVEKVANTYPIYRTGFRNEIEKAESHLAALHNLHRVGRQAAFLHDNIDEAVENATRLADEILEEKGL